ncbi:MAG TPA: hypothetical protein PLT08_16315, partial [Anaerolineales bacterium]|nr:hypothetical protein [Anaerolineales bacterium]
PLDKYHKIVILSRQLEKVPYQQSYTTERRKVLWTIYSSTWRVNGTHIVKFQGNNIRFHPRVPGPVITKGTSRSNQTN